MFFSIIIPVYNAEQTLERCLNSLRIQAFDDFEVIIIDDGSTDSSYAISENVKIEDPRFKLLRQENRGPSAARNEGLKRAQGEYVCFVDSDDYVTPDYLSQLYIFLRTNKAEVVFFGYHNVNQEGVIKSTVLPPTGLKGRALLVKLSEQDMFGYTWIKCFCRESIGDSAFPEDMSLFEDEIFSCSVLEKTDRIEVLPQPLYYYVSGGANMLTGRTHEDYCMISDRVFTAWESLLDEEPERKAFLRQKANYFVDRCKYYGFERDVDPRGYFESLAETHFFQIHTNWNKLDNQILHRDIIGIKAARWIYRMKQILRQR